MKKQFYNYLSNDLFQKENKKNKSVNRIYSVDSLAYEDEKPKIPSIYDNFGKINRNNKSIYNIYKEKDYTTNSSSPSVAESTSKCNIIAYLWNTLIIR